MVRRRDVAALYARLSPADARRFVADLYAARGWETAVEDGVVTARRDGVERRLRPVVSRPRPCPRPDADPDARPLSATDVARMVRYAVDDDARRALLRDHFDGAGPLPWRSRLPAGDALTALRERAPAGWRESAAGCLVAGLVLVALLGPLAGVGPGPGVGSSGGGGASLEAASVSGESTGRAGRPSYPPGVSPDGLTSTDLLAAAHRRLLDAAAFTWTLSYRVSEGNATRGAYRGTVRVASADVYAVETVRIGDLSAAPGVGEEVYADGVTEWYAANGTRCTRAVSGAGSYRARADRYVRALLRSNRSFVVDRTTGPGPTRYTLSLVGDPWPGDRAVSGRVRVDESGRIRSLRRVVERPDEGTRIAVRLRFSDWGETTVTRPAWVEAADTVPGGCYG
ncbi:MAG: hypothetical protein ABEJ06_03235 [Haloarculaceae archaeon]